MTVTIERVQIPDDVIAQAREAAVALDRIVPELMAVLDRASAAMGRVEVLRLSEWGVDCSDEAAETIRHETAVDRLYEHFYALHDRCDLDDKSMLGDEYERFWEAFCANL